MSQIFSILFLLFIPIIGLAQSDCIDQKTLVAIKECIESKPSSERAKSLLKDVVDNYDNKSQEWAEATRLLAMLRAKEL